MTRCSATDGAVRSRASAPCNGTVATLPSAGFTLVEILVALAVVGILAAMSTPSFRAAIATNHLESTRNDLAWDIRRARAESRARSTSLVLCPTDDGATCGSDWADGWMVFADVAGGARGEFDADDTVLHLHATGGRRNLSIAVQSRGQWSGVTTSADRLIFEGRRRGPSAFVTLCDDRGVADARGIMVSAAGEVSANPDRSSDGTLRDLWGVPITCAT